MAIHFSDIISSLTDMENNIFFHKDNHLTGIKYLKDNPDSVISDFLYIGEYSQFDQLSITDNSYFLILQDNNSTVSLHKNINAILFNDSLQYHKALQITQDLFDDQMRLSCCTDRLFELCQQGTTIQLLLDTGYEMLGNPMLLVDISLCFMAHVGGNTIENEPLWEWTLSNGYVTEEYVNSIMSADSEAEEDSRLILWESGLLKHRQLVGRVIKNRQTIAYLKVLEYNKPITRFDEQILIVLCKFLAFVIEDNNNSLSSSNTLTDSFLTALLNQKLYDHDAINERARSFNLKLYDNMYVLAIELTDMYKNHDKIYHLKRKLQNFLNRNTILIYGDYMVILYDTKEDIFLVSNEFVSLSQLLDKYNCKMGVSKVFHKLYDLSEHYKQAVTCLSIGKEMNYEEFILQYENIIVTHMILSFRDKTNLENLIHPIVRSLSTLDSEKNSNLTETLFCYLQHNQDINLTSKALHIHYNTLKYRIKRISELTNIDFHDSDLLFKIQLTQKVLQILRHNSMPY